MKKVLSAMIVAMVMYGQSFAQTNTFPASGNVGIGTTSPTQPLVVIGNAQISGQLRADLNATGNSLILTGTGSNLQVSHNGTSNVQLFNSGGGAFQFNNYSNSSTLFHIDGSGNVGIGTTSPIGNLDVRGASFIGTPDFSLGSAGSNLQIDQGASSGNTYSRIRAFSNGGTAVNNLVLQSSGGNVGIGTTTPSAKLEVNNGASGANVLVSNTVGGYVSLGISSNDASYANLNYTNNIRFEGGPVGIGVINSPVSLFQVDDGCTKASIGEASGSGLNYGTSYLGFNASRSDTTWFTNGDSHNNGGGVIYSSIFGDMYFAALPRTGGSGQTLTDTQVKNNIALRIDHINGTVYAKQVYVQTTGWPDFVFKKNYSLRPLSEVKTYIEQNQHLPDMPAASAVEKDGINLGEMNKALLKKVEELTLYLIDLKAEKDTQIDNQQSELKAQKEANLSQQEKIKQLELRLEKLEKLIDK